MAYFNLLIEIVKQKVKKYKKYTSILVTVNFVESKKKHFVYTYKEIVINKI